MDYELRIIVEKVAISSQEVIQRDTITSYALQCPTSIVELGLRHAEQIALLEKVQNIVLAEQSHLLDPGMPVCPTCGNTLKKNGYKASHFHALFSDHIVRIQKYHCSHPDCRWHSTPTITSLFGTNIHPDLASIQCAQGALLEDIVEFEPYLEAFVTEGKVHADESAIPRVESQAKTDVAF